MITDLGKSSSALKDIHLITGIGLCSNVYVIGRKIITLIDTGVGNQANRLAPRFRSLDLELKDVRQVILTHAHHDHTSGLLEILKEGCPKVLIHRLDAEFVSRLENVVKLDDGNSIETEAMPLTVIHTPGHTPGSICLYNARYGVLFSGDTVFPGGVFGRCDPEKGLIDMISSLRKLSSLKVEILLPGHEEPVLYGADRHIKAALKVAEEYSAT